MQVETKREPGKQYLSDKLDFKPKMVTRDNNGHTMIRKVIHQEDIAIINIYAPNIRAPKHSKEILIYLKGQIHNNLIVEDFNTLLSTR